MISVLYVDDEQALLDICKIYLERTGELLIQTESSVKKAIERLSLESFDAIISDFQMPEMDGIEFLKFVRGSGMTIPFIIFTGRGREEVAIAALKEGADFYLQKGGDPRAQFAELLNQINQIVRQRKAESSVRESEQMYRALFESAQDAIFLMKDGRIIDCNRQTELLYGRTKEELLGLSPVDLSPQFQADGQLSSEQVNFYINASLSGDGQSFDWKCIRNDGTLFDAEVSLNKISTNRGYVILYIIRDITKRKNDEIELLRKNEEIAASYEELMGAEEELREQYQMITRSEQELVVHEAKLNTIIQGSPIPQFIIDKDHLVIHWNTALSTYSGIAAEEVLGTDQHWKAFYQQKRPCLADILIEGHSDAFEKWYSNKYVKSPLIPDAYTAVDFFPLMKTEGVWLSFTAALIKDQNGAVIGAVETLEDITDQKRSAMVLAESEARYRRMIENMQDVFYQSDIEGRLIAASPSMLELLGYDSLDDCIGKNIAETFYFHPEDREDFITTISASGSVSRYLVTLKRRDGTPVDVSTSSHFYTGPDGKPAGIEGTFRDITIMKGTEAKLEREEAILNAVIGESPMPLFVIDKNHRVLFWNKALEKYSGILSEEVKGTNQQWRAFYQEERPCMADILVDGDTDHISQWYPGKYSPSRLIEGAYEAVDYFPDIGDNGSWLFFSAAPIRDDEGRVIGAVETLEDITQQKNAEFSLMESEERFRTLFTHAGDAIFLHRITSDGLPDVFIEVNETACSRLGYSREELLSMSPKDIDSRFSQDKEHEYTALLRKEGHVTFEAVHLTKDHDEIPVEITAHIYEFRGEKVVLSIVRDISERKRYELAIQNANTKLNLLSRITRHDILNQLT
ncbi:MAG: PAS domain S-box protein, partial [Methanobacteriota archaeon]